MLRTHTLPCQLRKTEADAFNAASGAIYTRTMVDHWRVYRQTGHWLSSKAGERLNDYRTRDDTPLLHSHSKDAAQQGFYHACTAAHAARKVGVDARFPRKRKRWRTTVWKADCIRVTDEALLLARARGLPPVRVTLPRWFQPATMQAREVRLVWDRVASKYVWHLVVEDGQQPPPPPGNAVVAVDPGEIHPAVLTDGQTAVVLSCRQQRAIRQYTAKRLATLASRQARTTRGSRRWGRLQRAKTRFRAKQARRLRDLDHKVSRAAVQYAVAQQAGTMVVGDVRDVADKTGRGAVVNQKLSSWRHGRLRQYLTYKAEAAGIVVALQDEAYTSQSCPVCRARHKPTGRVYTCRRCGYTGPRDVVGAVNILSARLHGAPGQVAPPPADQIRYRYPLVLGPPGKRSCPDTGQPSHPGCAVASGKPEEATALQCA